MKILLLALLLALAPQDKEKEKGYLQLVQLKNFIATRILRILQKKSLVMRKICGMRKLSIHG